MLIRKVHSDLYTFDREPVKREHAVKVCRASILYDIRGGGHTMLGRFDLGFGRNYDRALTAGRVLLAVSMLAGCSSVPDAINPIEWYKDAESLVTGRERTETAMPTPAKSPSADGSKSAADTRKDLTKGLPADKSNSKYAEPVRREVAPTKALARRAPAASETQVAALPEGAVPPKPAVTKQELADGNKLSPDRRAAQARDDGPNAPPSSVNMTPPAAADVPEFVPVRGRPRPLQEQFQRRLAESAQQSVTPGMVAMPRLASAGEEEPIHLVPPSSRRTVKGGGKGLAAPAPEPAASFQVAALDFRSGSSELTSTDRSSLAEVARLYKQTGGVVRVVGHAPASLFGRAPLHQMMGGLDASIQRANAVARELTKRGVPASKIMVGADPTAASQGEAGAQVYIDVI